MEVVSRYIESPPEDPGAPGAFRFAERGKLARLFAEAGAIDALVNAVIKFDLEAAITAKQFWEVRVELSDTLRAKGGFAFAEAVEACSSRVEEAGRAFSRPGA